MSVRRDWLIDNDVLIKLSAYGLISELLDMAQPETRVGVLSSARFVSRSVMEGSDRFANRGSALSNLDQALSAVTELEPSTEEVALATELEEASMLAGVDLDVGESLLCAVAISRSAEFILTGDKRAVISAEELAGSVEALSTLAHRFVCLEQIVASLVRQIGATEVAESVCAEQRVDTALAICAGCAIAERSEMDCACLASYVNSLRRSSPTMLSEVSEPLATS